MFLLIFEFLFDQPPPPKYSYCIRFLYVLILNADLLFQYLIHIRMLVPELWDKVEHAL